MEQASVNVNKIRSDLKSKPNTIISLNAQQNQVFKDLKKINADTVDPDDLKL